MSEMNRSFELLKLIKRVSESLKQEIHKQFGEMGFTAPQGMLIGAIMKKGPMKVSDISEMMSLSNSTVSGIIDRLEKSGHVMRCRSEEDKRIVMVDVSPEFKKQSMCAFNRVDDLLTRIISSANPEEVEEIIKGLSALDRVVQRHKGVEK